MLRACPALLVLCCSAGIAAESLAPPVVNVAPGESAAVIAHPDQYRLLDSTSPALAEHKALVYDFWRHVIVGGKAEDAPLYVNANYTEHNPLLPSGAHAFQEYVADRIRRNPLPARIEDLVTIVAEGPYVALAMVARFRENNASGATYTSTRFELFRIEGGLIAEHWDSTRLRAGQSLPDFGAAQALPALGASGAAQHALLMNDDAALFANKRLVFDFRRQVQDAGRAELAELYVNPVYIEHSPNTASLRAAENVTDGAIATTLQQPLIAMLAEGDLVIQVRAPSRDRAGADFLSPTFDMFRIANGRVVEHWDTAVK